MAKLFNKYAPGMKCTMEVEIDEVRITDLGVTYRVFIETRNGDPKKRLFRRRNK